ncbi:MAG: class I SAM-dependent methyltransferase [Bacteroidia bacterium]|nr:class I SAM-dependent methyltransferase [Bacteroidia bacterium]
MEKILQGKQTSPYFDIIETTRKKMLKSNSAIDFTDYGTGNKSGKRQISEIAANTARNAKYSKFLFRLIQYLNPEFSLELGTGSGITALYQGAALGPANPLHTIEGSSALSDVAAFNAEQCGLQNNIVFHKGTFESVLPQLLAQIPRVDYAYIDGNHSYKPTIDYFDQLLPKLHESSVLVFDDINWSEDMKNAWAVIRSHPKVTVTIDIFAFGIVFFRQGQEKEHFILRY